MTAHRLSSLALAFVAAAALAGCSSSTATTAAAPPTTGSQPVPTTSPLTSTEANAGASAGATTSAPLAPRPVDAGVPEEGQGPPVPPEAESAELAQSRATAFMRAFARTDLPQQQWWDGVAGYFTPAAWPVYRTTDVANVPVHEVVEGSAALLPNSTEYRAEVSVDTDAGTYTVMLLRADEDWLVDRATPPS